MATLLSQACDLCAQRKLLQSCGNSAVQSNMVIACLTCVATVSMAFACKYTRLLASLLTNVHYVELRIPSVMPVMQLFSVQTWL